MDRKFKVFVAFCAVAVAVVFSMNEAKANKSSSSEMAKGCYGSGACGITSENTILVGKWRE